MLGLKAKLHPLPIPYPPLTEKHILKTPFGERKRASRIVDCADQGSLADSREWQNRKCHLVTRLQRWHFKISWIWSRIVTCIRLRVILFKLVTIRKNHIVNLCPSISLLVKKRAHQAFVLSQSCCWKQMRTWKFWNVKFHINALMVCLNCLIFLWGKKRFRTHELHLLC